MYGAIIGPVPVLFHLSPSVLVTPGAVFSKSQMYRNFDCNLSKVVLSCEAGKNYLSALPVTVGGCPSIPEGTSAPSARRGGGAMMTYSEFFQFCLVVIGICGLFLQVHNSKKK